MMKMALPFPTDGAAEAPSLPLALALAVAIALHVSLGLVTPRSLEPAHRPPLRTMEVDLTVPPPDPPAPRADPVPPLPEPKTASPSVTRSVAARGPAAAPKVLTAEPTAQASDAPLDFVTDTNGSAFGFGVVARGGSSVSEGRAGPVVTAPSSTPVETPKPPGLADQDDLSERPRLVGEDPCSGYYPGAALSDAASATVRVVVESDGRVRAATLLAETPPAQGFGRAAEQCLRAGRFTAPRDKTGRAVATATTVRVHFRR